MTTRKRPEADRRHLCAQIHEEDGSSPRFDVDESRIHERAKARRKDLQLCKQVRLAIESALSSGADTALHDAIVVDVEPAPDASRLRVRLASRRGEVHLPELMHRIVAAVGYLRGEVAAATSRKRVPVLVFERMAPETQEELEAGDEAQ